MPSLGSILVFGSNMTGATSFSLAMRMSRMVCSSVPGSLREAATAVFHEVYHANTFVRTGLQGAEEAAEAFGKSMWAKFVAAG